MTLITGANGHLGTATLQSFKTSNPDKPIAGMVRSPEKGEQIKKLGAGVRIGDYQKPETLTDAFDGITTLLLISSSTFEYRVQQHKNVIEAAANAGVHRIFYTSMLQANKELSPLAKDHSETEKALRASGIPFTIFRHTFYTEFLPMFFGGAPDSGKWIFPSGGQPVTLAYRTDMAEALANALADPSKHEGKIYEISTNTSHTLKNLAEVLGNELGNEITYVDPPIDDFVGELKKAGLPDEVVSMSRLSAQTVVNGALGHTSSHLEQLLGRPQKSMEQFIRDFARQNT
ncbi:MAG: SDR family oxidoreductase [Balneolaceae bacterium]